MKNNFLTAQKFAWGYLVNLFVKDSTTVAKFPHLKKYKSYKTIRLQQGENFNSVAMAQNSKNENVIIKHLAYKTNILAYHQLINEASMLDLLQTHNYKDSRYQIKFPKIYETVLKKNEAYIVMEFIDGQLLDRYPSKVQYEVLKSCLKALLSITAAIPEETKKLLPSRTPLIMHLTAPIFAVLAAAKEPRSTWVYTKMLINYYFLSLKTLFSTPEFVLSHKSLHLENIMVNDTSITIIDPQVSVMAEKYTDLAMSAIMYLDVIGHKKLKDLLKIFITTNTDKDMFLKTTAYFCLQNLALSAKTSEFYKESTIFIHAQHERIIDKLISTHD